MEPEDHPIGDTNEERLEEYFKHKKPSSDNIEDHPINVAVKSKQKKVENEEEYYDGYIEEPARERSPGAEKTEQKRNLTSFI